MSRNRQKLINQSLSIMYFNTFKKSLFSFFSILCVPLFLTGQTSGEGDVCSTAIEVNALPYSTTDNTGNYGDDYTGTDIPPVATNAVIDGTSPAFLWGDDVVYSYTPTDDAFVDITLSGIRNNGGGIYVFTGCPFDSTRGSNTAFIVENIDIRRISNLPVTSGTTYYIVVSSNTNDNQSIDYTLTVNAAGIDCPVSGVEIGTTCDDGDSQTVNDVVRGDCTCSGIPVAANNTACTATEIFCGDFLLDQSILNATSTRLNPCGGVSPDLFYKFISDGTQEYTITLEDIPGEFGWDGIVELLVGDDCLNLSIAQGCQDLPENYTITEAGTYYFVVRPFFSFEADDFGVSLECVESVCEAGVLDDSETLPELCPGEITSIAVSGIELPATAVDPNVAVSFKPVPGSGTGGNEVGFSIINIFPEDIDPVTGPWSFDNDINGILSSNSLPPLLGEWVLQPYVYEDIDNFFDTACDSTAESVIVDFLSEEACDEFVTECEAGTLDAASVATDLCSDESTDFSFSGITIPNSPDNGAYRISLEPVPGSGAGGPFNGGAFFLTFDEASLPPGSENIGLNTTISATLVETTGTAQIPMEGEWIISGLVSPTSDSFDSCDETAAVTINFRTEDDPFCTGVAPCEIPYPAVDANSLALTLLPDGSISFSWSPIPGQIGCRVNARARSGGQVVQQTSIVVAGVNANQFTAGSSVLNSGFEYDFRVQCGCSQTPLIVGPYTPFVSIAYLPGAITQAGEGAEGPFFFGNDFTQNEKRDFRSLEKLKAFTAPAALMAGALPHMKQSALEANVFPNPNSGSFFLALSDLPENGRYEIYDVLGRRVKESRIIHSREEINLPAAGIYTLLLIDDGDLLETIKIVVQ